MTLCTQSNTQWIHIDVVQGTTTLHSAVTFRWKGLLAVFSYFGWLGIKLKIAASCRVVFLKDFPHISNTQADKTFTHSMVTALIRLCGFVSSLITNNVVWWCLCGYVYLFVNCIPCFELSKCKVILCKLLSIKNRNCFISEVSISATAATITVVVTKAHGHFTWRCRWCISTYGAYSSTVYCHAG